MMIASNLACFICSRSLSRSLLGYPRLPLDIDAEHLEVETLRSAELLQAALHVPASRSPREKVQDSQGFLSCHRCRRWQSCRMRIGRPRSGVRTLRIGCLAGRCGALMSRARPEAYRAHMSEVALSALLASSFGIVAEANGLIIGRPGRALAGLPGGWLSLSACFLASFLAALSGLLGTRRRGWRCISRPLAIEG